jgi:hypothetical protein
MLVHFHVAKLVWLQYINFNRIVRDYLSEITIKILQFPYITCFCGMAYYLSHDHMIDGFSSQSGLGAATDLQAAAVKLLGGPYSDKLGRWGGATVGESAYSAAR